jgi:tripartite-type tricarboxylate transporter receptor subunit TctC
MHRRGCLGLAGGLLFAPLARADAYPARPVRLVVNAAPGGPGDFLARMYAGAAASALGGSFVVEHKAGASGTLGAELVTRLPPDGHGLLVSGPSAVSAAPHMRRLAYDPARDLAPVAMLGAGAFLLAVHPSLDVGTTADLVQLARARPGALAYGSGGPGSSSHLCAEQFCDAVGVEMTHVGYKGEGQAIADLLAGHLQLMFTAPNVALRHARERKLRLLAVTARERLAVEPALPALAESVEGFEYLAWQALFAPAQVPAAVVDALASAWRAARANEVVRGRLLELGMAGPDVLVSGEPLNRFLRAESERLGRLIRAAGIRAD